MKITDNVKIKAKNTSESNIQMCSAWINTTSNTSGYYHMKTNITKSSNIMYRIHAEGYNYGRGEAIDSTWTGYTYSGWTIIDNGRARDYTNGIDAQRGWSSPVKFGSYYSTDNYLCIAAYATTWYYAGWVLHAMFPCPNGRNHNFSIIEHSLQQVQKYY